MDDLRKVIFDVEVMYQNPAPDIDKSKPEDLKALKQFYIHVLYNDFDKAGEKGEFSKGSKLNPSGELVHTNYSSMLNLEGLNKGYLEIGANEKATELLTKIFMGYEKSFNSVIQVIKDRDARSKNTSEQRSDNPDSNIIQKGISRFEGGKNQSGDQRDR